MIKFIDMLKIHLKQNINFQLRNKEITRLKHFHDSKAVIEYSNDIKDDIFIEEYNPNKEHKY